MGPTLEHEQKSRKGRIQIIVVLLFTLVCRSVFADDAQEPSPLAQGIASFERGDFNQARNQFEAAVKFYPSLKEYTHYWLAKTLNQLHRSEEALPLLSPPSSFRRRIDSDIFWEYFQTQVLLKHGPAAEAALSQWQKVSGKNTREQLKIIYGKGLLAASQGRNTQARSLWKTLLIKYPFSEQEADVLNKLGGSIESLLSPQELKNRADNLLDAGLPREGLKLLQKLAPKGLVNSKDIASATYKSRDYREAAVLYQKLWDSGQRDVTTLNNLANSYGRSDQFDKALVYHQKITEQYPTSREAMISRYKIAFIYFDSSDYKKAHDAFLKLMADKKVYQKEKVQWYLFWSAYLLRSYPEAMSLLERIEKVTRDKKELNTIDYWRARILEQTGRARDAQGLYSDLAARDPWSYYGLLSSQRLIEGGIVPDILVDVQKISDLPSAPIQTESTAWINRLDIHQPLRKAILLSQAGLLAPAYEESVQTEPVDLSYDELSQALLAAHNFNRVYAMGINSLKAAPSGASLPFYLSLAYPQAYPEWVEAEAARFGISPLLVWSIMREESAFKPSALSNANAFGLMQVIPQTGMEIATSLNVKNFNPYQLNDPQTAIRFGAFYLKELSSHFQGTLIKTIASYNAGPDAVDRWEKWGDKLPADLFIELIPYDETSDYVKKVIRSYWIYDKLYSSLQVPKNN